jgi:NAD(P)-dependent dehydrogenase (short-subunit alcohol dehydrogenase family)
MGNFLVIGASSGMGNAIALQLIKEGHEVYGTFNSHPIESVQNFNTHQV